MAPLTSPLTNLNRAKSPTRRQHQQAKGAVSFADFAALVRSHQPGQHGEGELRARYEALRTLTTTTGNARLMIVTRPAVITLLIIDAIRSSRTKVIDLFSKWDEDQSGGVSRDEFRKAVRNLGFCASSCSDSDIDACFDALDENASGQVSFHELGLAVDRVIANHHAALQGRLRGSALKHAGAALPSKLALATQGETQEDMGQNALEQLRHAVASSLQRVTNVFQEWDTDGDGRVSRREFHGAMAALSFEAPREAIDSLFDLLDRGGSGSLGLDDLEAALKAPELHGTGDSWASPCRGSSMASRPPPTPAPPSASESLQLMVDEARQRCAELQSSLDEEVSRRREAEACMDQAKLDAISSRLKSVQNQIQPGVNIPQLQAALRAAQLERDELEAGRGQVEARLRAALDKAQENDGLYQAQAAQLRAAIDKEASEARASREACKALTARESSRDTTVSALQQRVDAVERVSSELQAENWELQKKAAELQMQLDAASDVVKEAEVTRQAEANAAEEKTRQVEEAAQELVALGVQKAGERHAEEMSAQLKSAVRLGALAAEREAAAAELEISLRSLEREHAEMLKHTAQREAQTASVQAAAARERAVRGGEAREKEVAMRAAMKRQLDAEVAARTELSQANSALRQELARADEELAESVSSVKELEKVTNEALAAAHRRGSQAVKAAEESKRLQRLSEEEEAKRRELEIYCRSAELRADSLAARAKSHAAEITAAHEAYAALVAEQGRMEGVIAAVHGEQAAMRRAYVHALVSFGVDTQVAKDFFAVPDKSREVGGDGMHRAERLALAASPYASATPTPQRAELRALKADARAAKARAEAAAAVARTGGGYEVVYDQARSPAKPTTAVECLRLLAQPSQLASS